MSEVDATPLAGAYLPPGLNLALSSLDLPARLLQTWLELQQSLWQPWLDIHGQWLAAVAPQSAWPLLSRGTEQLA